MALWCEETALFVEPQAYIDTLTAEHTRLKPIRFIAHKIPTKWWTIEDTNQ